MKKNIVATAFVTLIAAACNSVETPPKMNANVVDAAASPKADAAVKTVTASATATATATASATNDAGTVIVTTQVVTVTQIVTVPVYVTVTVASTNTGTGTGTGTSANTATNTGSGTGTGNTADAAATVDAPLPQPDSAPAQIADTAPACNASDKVVCDQPFMGQLCHGSKDCENGQLGVCKYITCPGPDADTTDRTAPVVETPFCGLANATGLPINAAIPFYVKAQDGTGVVACAFYLNNIESGIAVLETDDTWQLDISLPKSGTYFIVALCADAAGNIGQSSPLTVSTAGMDAGVAPSADAQAPVADAKPALDAKISADKAPVVIIDAGADTVIALDALIAADAQAPTDATPVAVTDAGSDAQAVPADAQALADATTPTDSVALPDADYSKGWPYIDCVSTDATGAFVNITLYGNIGGQGTDGVSNLIDQQSSPWVHNGSEICLVGDDGIGWSSRDYCLPWVGGATLMVFSSVPVNVTTLTEINYVIDDGAGNMIWGNNARLIFTASSVNRCDRGGSKGNLIVGSNIVASPDAG